MKRVRCAIVGLGRIGSLLEEDRLREKPCTHAGAVAKNRDCILAGGCDISRERRELFSKRWKCENVYSDLDLMLKETSADILHVATPVETHLAIIRKTLHYPIKLIICEKPLAEKGSDASRIARFHESGRVKILTNHERRYSKDYQSAKRHIERKTFGRLLSISSCLYMGERRSVEGMLLDDGTHMIDIIQYLTSERLKKREAQKFYERNRETLHIVSEAGNIPVFFEIGSGRDYITFELDLSFSSGRIRIGNGIYEEHESRRSPYYEGMKSLVKNAAKRPRKTGYFKNMLIDAVRCVRDGSKAPLSSAVDGSTVIEFIDSVKRDLLDGGALSSAPPPHKRERLIEAFAR